MGKSSTLNAQRPTLNVQRKSSRTQQRG